MSLPLVLDGRPVLIDTYCGGGGAGSGYDLAGFQVIGVDKYPQPNYPFHFVQADALEFLQQIIDLRGFAPVDAWWLTNPFGKSGASGFPCRPRVSAIHASPVCKAHTKTGWAYHFGYHANHSDLLTPTRALLEQQPAPWVIENVPGAPMRVDMMLCGSQFGLGVRRHRWFEFGNWSTFNLMQPCDHSRRVVSPHGHPNRFKGSGAEWAVGMGIDWMSSDELAQAIPPAYTEYVGRELLAHLAVAA